MNKESSAADIAIRLLGEDDHLAATGLLAHLNPDCPGSTLVERFRTILADHPHYHPYGAFLDGRMVGFAGVWIGTRIWSGRYLEVDNLVVHPGHRSLGVGTLLLDHFVALARERDCRMVVLDSYTSNHPSHRLYHRLGFEIWGYHFVKPLAGDLR